MTQLRSFLRLGSNLVELLDRPLVVGRSSGCDLVVEDELASREHCRIALEGERVVLTDLESRNGVLLNGVRVSGRQELHHGDTITIGTHQIMLLRQHRAPRLTPAVGTSVDDGDEEPTRQGDIFQLLLGAASAALASGDVLGAEGGARNLFVVLRASIARAGSLPPDVLAAATELALGLAEETNEPRWLEQALDVYVAGRAVLSPAHTRQLTELARRIGTPQRAVDDYVRVAGGVPGGEASARALKLL